MDPTTLAAPSGVLGWIAQYGNAVFFFAQLAYWFCIVLFFGYAVAQFKRWVNFQLGTGRSGQLKESPTDKVQAPAVSVEEFVE